jgi:hypothetical protein
MTMSTEQPDVESQQFEELPITAHQYVSEAEKKDDATRSCRVIGFIKADQRRGPCLGQNPFSHPMLYHPSPPAVVVDFGGIYDPYRPELAIPEESYHDSPLRLHDMLDHICIGRLLSWYRADRE